MSSRNRLARLEDSFLPLPPPLSPSFSRFLFFDVMAHVDALRAKIEGLQVRAAPPPPPPPPKRDRGKKEPRGATIGRRSSRLTFVSSPSVPLSHLSLSLPLLSSSSSRQRHMRPPTKQRLLRRRKNSSPPTRAPTAGRPSRRRCAPPRPARATRATSRSSARSSPSGAGSARGARPSPAPWRS